MIEIVQAARTKQIYTTLAYFLLTGMLVPTFGEITYYFSINVIEFSKFTISLLTLLGFFSLLGGTMVYNKYFQDYEFRTLL